MKFNFNSYKIKKTKYYFKNKQIFFIFFTVNSKSNYLLLLKQELIKLNFISFNINNTLTKTIIKYSIFKYFKNVIEGPILFANFNLYNKLRIKSLLDLTKNIDLLGLKVNNKIYSRNQLKRLKNFSYFLNLQEFNGILQVLLKNSCFTV